MGFDRRKTIGFIDVASGKVCVMLMSIDKDSNFSLIGSGEVESFGYKGGKILDFTAFSKSINQALEMAEKEAKENISDVVISLSDFKYKSYFLPSKIGFSFERKITAKDIKNVTSLIPLQQNIDVDKEALVHIIPMEFIIDNDKIVDNPEGEIAKNLTVHYHVITVDARMYSDLISVFKSLNLNVKRVVAGGYASALAVLIEDDKKVGSLVLDIGKSTMSAAIFMDDRLVYNYSLPLGGDAITNSLSKQINVRVAEAERLKIKYGAKAPVSLDFSDYINLFMIGENGENDEQEVLKSDFLTVSNNITKGFFSILRKCLDDRRVLSCVHRVVITGGGSKLLGLKDIAKDIFNCPVRIAKPIIQSELSEKFNEPEYSTLLGLFAFYKTKVSGDYVFETSDDGDGKNFWNKFMKFWMENFG